jgi:hypothetical protein
MPNTQIIVSTASELTKAIKSVKGGETILLAPGNYGNFAFVGTPASTVTIKSLDPNNDAVFRSLKLTRADNFRIEDVDINNPQGSGSVDKALVINLSKNISIIGVDIAGSKDGNAWNDGYGAFITSSDNIAILDSTFVQTRIAIVAGRATNLVVAGNDISQSREGVQVGQINGGIFDRNYLHDMNPAPTDHADFFQVQAGGTTLNSRGLTFTNNVMIQGSGGMGIHGIFIRSEKEALGIRHSDITIENNYYSGAALHGVSVSDVNNVSIKGNTVLFSGNSTVNLVPAIFVSGVRGAEINNNVTPMLSERVNSGNTNIAYGKNIDVWDAKTRKGLAMADLFAPPTGSGDIDFSSLAARAGSAAAGLGFKPVAGIGNLHGTSDAIFAAYAPQNVNFETLHHFI